MQLQTLSPRAYACQGEVEPDHVRENAGFVLTQHGVVVIDTTRTLTDAIWVYRQIRTLTDKRVAYVINTHFHMDHINGNQVFGAPIIATELERQRMASLLATEWSAEGLAKQIREYAVPQDLQGLRIVLPDITFSDRLTLHMGDLELELIPVGGHTPGSCMVYVPQEEVLYIGDLLFVGRYPAMMHASLKQWLAALDRVKGLKAKVVVPGHGRMATMEDLKPLQSYLEDLRERVTRLAGQGLSKQQVMDHPGFPRYAEKAYQRSHKANIGVVYDELISAR